MHLTTAEERRLGPEGHHGDKPQGLLFLRIFGVDACRDAEGRPLREGKARAEYRRCVPMEMAQCPYPGVRFKHEKLMNVSALRQMLRHWDEVLGGFSFLRTLLIREKPASEVTLLDFWRIAKAGSSLPFYLIHRAVNPLGDGRLPAPIASIYKASLGLFGTAQNMVLKGMFAEPRAHAGQAKPDAILAFAENEGNLVGKSEVCAGPARLIGECIETIIEPNGAASSIPKLIPEADSLISFLHNEQLLYLVNFAFPIISYAPLHELFRRIDSEPEFSASFRQAVAEVEKNYPEAARKLEARGEPLRNRSLANLYSLFADLDPTDQVNAGLRNACDPPESDRRLMRAALEELIRLVPKNHSLNGGALALLTEGLASYLLVERTRLTLHSWILSKINAALGRNAPVRNLDQSDITEEFGRTLRDVLTEFLGIRVLNTPFETVIQVGERSAIV